MSNTTYDFGMVGLGVMGRNFLLNVADHGYSVVGLDKDSKKVQALETEAGDKPAKGTTTVEEFVAHLSAPRKIMLLVPAGKVVDIVIEDLLPHLSPGDLIIDGGNSFFEDTDRRSIYLQEKGFHFLGTGVSGGAKGARLAPSIMPGGSKDAYALAQPILEAVSAKVRNDPCVAFMGNGSAGHYVKMVHNGIEYGLMQLLAESYDLLKHIGGLSNPELHEVYSSWNQGRLRSFLIEITAAIFTQKDELTTAWLVDQIMDKAKQKGTGKWTSQHGMDLGIPVPTIDSAVTMRGLSALKSDRISAESAYPLDVNAPKVDRAAFLAHMEKALFFATILTYAQGFHLLHEASKEKGFALDMEAIARIWRGGCIIRADLLEDIRQAFNSEPVPNNLILAPVFQDMLNETHSSARSVMKAAIDVGRPALCFSSALAYFDSYRNGRLPLNLVQAQRDYFGSHTYERLDREGIFHTEWNDQ